MGLSVIFVSGVRRSGKSAVIHSMIDRLWKIKPHYIRLVQSGTDKTPPKASSAAQAQCGIASARWLEYDSERVFEIIQEALTITHCQDRFGCVVIEADSDADLRHAYPYDHRVFVMPVPSSLDQVFRDPDRAAIELQRVLDDTAAFASEIFGLRADGRKYDSDPSEYRQEFTPTQMRGFLNSPLGDELATRVQLQPEYHGLVESDVIVVNNRIGEAGRETEECLRRISRLLERTCVISGRGGQLFLCDPINFNGKGNKKLLKALKPMCAGGK